MSVNFNSILGSAGGGGGSFPLTLSMALMAGNKFGAGSPSFTNLGVDNYTFTIDRNDSEITITPTQAKSGGHLYGTQIAADTYYGVNVLSISVTPATSRNVDSGIYFINKDSGLINVDFGEYRDFMQEIQKEQEAREAQNNTEVK